ncbi:MAG: hypothetical protein U0746_12715 [Gemmataceae bacterium]
MIVGTVNSRLEAAIVLVVYDPAGAAHSFDVAIDTGYNGELTLPTADVARLGLAWLWMTDHILADGSIQRLDVYSATVEWDGTPRPVRVVALDPSPLLGMRVLDGHDVFLRVKAGGIARIDVSP